MVKNIFVAGLDNYHLSQLLALQRSADYRFRPLMSYKQIKCQRKIPVRQFLHHAEKVLSEFNGLVDAIIGYWDFPVSTMLPLLRKTVGLTGPDLETVLKCEHKYWSRLLQEEVVPDIIPSFEPINPFDDDAIEHCTLAYPFWLKPVKAVLSHLGFLVSNREEFRQCLGTIRESIHRYGEPFNYILDMADLPPLIRQVDGYWCLGESLISEGRQCTLEGYVYHGEVVFYGCVDSIREGSHHSCFSRYQYPSRLPLGVQERMKSYAVKVLKKIAYDNSPFNIEFYWNHDNDTISLLEINTRISKSHGPLFKMVDGEYHHSIVIDIALDRTPRFPHRLGRFNIAAKFMLRSYKDGSVIGTPEAADLVTAQQLYPGTEIMVKIDPGTRLSGMLDQDSYSYEIAEIYLGADDEDQLLEKYQGVCACLPFTIDYLEEEP